MADPLDARLAALRGGPLPALAPAASVRARGDQRRARSRLAAGAAMAVVAVLAGVALAAGPAGRDALQPAPFATQPATTDPEPSPRAPSPSPPPPSVDPALLLSADAVGEALGGVWTADADRQDAYAGLHPCPEQVPALAGRVRGYTGPDRRGAGQTVLLLADEAAAARAFAQLVDDVERCPVRPEDSEDGRATVAHDLLGGLPGTGPDRAYVRTRSRDCDDCTVWEGVTAVAPVGRHLVLAGVSTGRPGPMTDEELARVTPLADAAIALVRCAPPQCSRPPVQVFPAAFLTPEQASQAEAPGWSVDEAYEPATEPLLDPCGDQTEPPGARDSGERAMSSRREAGGSSLVQEVFVHDDDASAQAALEAYLDRVRRCPIAPAPQSPPDHTVERSLVEVADDQVLVRERYCGPECTDLYTTWVLLCRAGRLLSVARYGITEDGDPHEATPPLLAAVHAQLVRAGG